MRAMQTAVDDQGFVEAVLARARAAGAEHGQAMTNVSDRIQVTFDRDVRMVRGTHSEMTMLSLGTGMRIGRSSLSGRDPSAVAAAIDEALAAAAAAAPCDVFPLARPQSQAPTRHGDETADVERLMALAAGHSTSAAQEYPQIVAREGRYEFKRLRRTFLNSFGETQQETRGLYSFGLEFAARRAGVVTGLSAYGLTSLEPLADPLNDALRRRFAETIAALEARPLRGKFVGDIIIAPPAMGLIVSPLARHLSGSALLSPDRSYALERGKRIASPGFTLRNCPRSPSLAKGADFDGAGLPTQDIAVISDGILENFLISFEAAARLGLPANAGWSSFVIDAGDSSLETMISRTERGLLLARFAGPPSNNDLDFSGFAKHAFYIVDGAIAHPVTETMISGNLKQLLLNIKGISAERTNSGGSLLPYVAAAGVVIQGSE